MCIKAAFRPPLCVCYVSCVELIIGRDQGAKFLMPNAHTTSDGNAVLRVESLPFASIPGQSKLFVKYQSDPLALRKFFPAAVENHTKINQRLQTVIENHVTDRSELVSALWEDNQRFGARDRTLENIELLRDHDSVAIVTGQQAGLFAGPLYTIYKALSAMRMAECLTNRGVKAVPVFWIASEDHDFDEVSKAFVLDAHWQLSELTNWPEMAGKELPVGAVPIDGSIIQTISRLQQSLLRTEFTERVIGDLAGSWAAGNSFADGMAQMLAGMFGRRGLVILDPRSPQVKRMAAPIYVQAIRKSAEITRALIARGDELEAAGFHSQVKVDSNYFPLFWHDENGSRRALKTTTRGTLVTKDRSHEFSIGDLEGIADQNPELFSPGVMLRPVVQDFLLPTLCYFGGGAEVAYFAQNSEVYRILNRPATTIFHRQSFTVVEPRNAKITDRLNVHLPDLFEDNDKLKLHVAERMEAKDSARLFAEVEERINGELNRLDQHIAPLDPTVAANLAKRRRKMLYHIGAVRKKFYISTVERNEILDRQVSSLLSGLLPAGQLQERVLNITYFLNKYGPDFNDWIYDSISLDDRGHRLIYL